MLVTHEYEPYVSMHCQRKGFLHEIVEAAFTEVGIGIEVEYRPWRRCALLVEEGVAFAAFPYGKTDRREEPAWFSDEIGECRNVFFYHKARMDDFVFTDLAALRPYLIAGTSGHYYEDIFRKERLRVDYAPGEASGVRKIRMMRADLFAEDEMVGWSLIARIFPSSVDKFASTPPWNINPQYLMVSKRYPGAKQIMERFNKGLAAIRKKGIYGRIYSKYGIQ